MGEPTPAEVLDLPLGDNPAGAATLREYLVELLFRLWERGADFNAKRPYGEGSWQYDVYDPLVRAGWVHGTFDGDGYLDEVDIVAADALIEKAIRHLGGAG